MDNKEMENRCIDSLLEHGVITIEEWRMLSKSIKENNFDCQLRKVVKKRK